MVLREYDFQLEIMSHLTASSCLMLKLVDWAWYLTITSVEEGSPDYETWDDAVSNNSIGVLDFIHYELKVKFTAIQLPMASDLPGVFRWLVEHCRGLSSEDMLLAYSKFCLYSKSYLAIVDAYEVVEPHLQRDHHHVKHGHPDSKYKLSSDLLADLACGLNFQSVLTLYDRYHALPLVDKVLPQITVDNIITIAVQCSQQVGYGALSFVVQFLDQQNELTESYVDCVVIGALSGGRYDFIDWLIKSKYVDLKTIAQCVITLSSGPIHDCGLSYISDKTDITDDIVISAICKACDPTEHLIDEAVQRRLDLPLEIFCFKAWRRSDPELCLKIVQHGGLPDTTGKVLHLVRKKWPDRELELIAVGFR